MRADVTIIGAGPAGLIAARTIASRNFDVKVVEEHRDVGVPNHCAGLLSIKGMREINAPTEGTFIENYLRGAKIYSPSGLTVTIERKEPVACVLNRELFDKFLAKKATEFGVEILLETRAEEVLFTNDDESIVRTSTDSINSRFVVDAEGVSSRIVESLKLRPLDKKNVLRALQFDLVDVTVNGDLAEIHLNRELAPGFFCWVIPTGKDKARVGLAGRRIDAYRNLEAFVKERFGTYDVETVRGGFIITSGPIQKTFFKNVAIVGDAAGQVKPTTGGGIVFGGISSSICGRVIAKALEGKKCGRLPLIEYEKLWRERLGRELKVMRAIRKIVDSLPDRVIDRAFKAIIDKQIDLEVSELGDMDFQSEALFTILRVLPKPLIDNMLKRYL